MTDDDLFRLIGQLQRHEGIRLLPYRDTVGKISVGVGRNLTDVGISREEADYLLSNDIERARDSLMAAFPWFTALDSVRQCALTNICFNMGLSRLTTFANALGAMRRGDYDKAADAFFDSKWATQVGHRAVELTDQIRSGEWVK